MGPDLLDSIHVRAFYVVNWCCTPVNIFELPHVSVRNNLPLCPLIALRHEKLQESLQACGPVHCLTSCSQQWDTVLRSFTDDANLRSAVDMSLLPCPWHHCLYCSWVNLLGVYLTETTFWLESREIKKITKPAWKTVMPRYGAVKNVIKWRRNCSKTRLPMPVCDLLHWPLSTTQRSEVIAPKANFAQTLTFIDRDLSIECDHP